MIYPICAESAVKHQLPVVGRCNAAQIDKYISLTAASVWRHCDLDDLL